MPNIDLSDFYSQEEFLTSLINRDWSLSTLNSHLSSCKQRSSDKDFIKNLPKTKLKVGSVKYFDKKECGAWQIKYDV